MPKPAWYLLGALAAAVIGIAGVLQFKAGETGTVTKATAKDIHEILATNVDEVLQQIALEKVEVSLPLDGKGARVLVRVEKGAADKVPKSITVKHQSRQLEVPLEASETYEQYKAQ